MKKKIRDLTDEEIYKKIYSENKDWSAKIIWNNCKFCKNYMQHNPLCFVKCEVFESNNIKLIDTNAIRASKYKDDEIEVQDE